MPVCWLDGRTVQLPVRGLFGSRLTAVDASSNEQCSPLSLLCSTCQQLPFTSDPCPRPRFTPSLLSTPCPGAGPRRAKKNGAGQASMLCQSDLPADAAADADRDPCDAALAHAQLASQIAAQTLRLIDVMHATDGNFVQRVQSVVDLLKEDADRPESLIDLIMPLEDDELESCVMFELLHFLSCTVYLFDDDDDVRADKAETEELIFNKLLPLLPHLLRSFDPATVNAKTGNNALHEMCRLFFLHGGWPCDLLEQLIALGVSVHARNTQGRTPLLEYASAAGPELSSAVAIRLLLDCGADLHAQDADGNGVLHHLVIQRAHGVMKDFCRGGQAEQPDFALLNAAGQTAVDLAAIQVAEIQLDDPDEEENEAEEEAQRERLGQARLVHRVVAAHTWAWTKHARPALLLCLETALPVGVAQLALSYVDGSGSPFDHEAHVHAQAEAEADE